MKIVYALPFEPVVQSRSILGLSLPSSVNGNCEWPLPVHWNCLFVSNQGAFNMSRVSGRSALIWKILKLKYTSQRESYYHIFAAVQQCSGRLLQMQHLLQTQLQHALSLLLEQSIKHLAVSKWFLNGTSAYYRLFSARKLEIKSCKH